MSTPTSNTGSSGGGGSAGRRRGREPKDSVSVATPPSTVSKLSSSQHVPRQGQQGSSHSDLTNNCSRLFTVAVVGLSGSEREKGDVGVGKSCLCNRFVRPFEDDYRVDHISTLSPVDFSGRVVNNDHWLYWGDRTLIADDRSELSFRVIEQTEFVDDISFQPFKSNAAQRDSYQRRCSALRLQSADKLMYIRKDQLGLESEYEQKPLPEGRAVIDGFLCVFDVSRSQPNRPFEKQTEFVVQILQNLLKLKKPVVLLTTKNDDLEEKCAKEAEKLASKREFKSLVPMVESSAHKNVNVEVAFMLLAHLIDKTRHKPKIVSFSDALKNRHEIMDVAAAAYKQKLRSLVHDYRISWVHFSRRLMSDPDFQHFCELSGRSEAQLLFQQHQKELKERHAQHKLRRQIEKLPQIFAHLLPDLEQIQGKSWEEVRRILPALPNFSRIFEINTSPNMMAAQHFVKSPASDLICDDVDDIGFSTPQSSVGFNGRENNFSNEDEQQRQRISHNDHRWSIDVLYRTEAEDCFKNHLLKLETDNKRRNLLDDFLRLLKECGQVTPGKPLSDVRIFFIGKECFESLSESDLQTVYDQYQKQLIRTATYDFLELLQEQVDEFVNRVLFRRNNIHNPSLTNAAVLKASLDREQVKSRYNAPVGCLLTAEDWRQLSDKLQEDARYRRLNRLHQSRDSLIARFASFLHYPLRRHCPAESCCADSLVENVLHKIDSQCKYVNSDRSCPQIQSPPVKAEFEITINLILLDFDGVAGQFICETRAHLKNNEFLYNNRTFRFEYKCIDCANGDGACNDSNCVDTDSTLFSRLIRQQHRIDGLICLFSSRSSLDVIMRAFANEISPLLRTVVRKSTEEMPPTEISSNDCCWSQGFRLPPPPLVFLLACDPTHLDDLPFLQQKGAFLADEFAAAAFVGLEPSNTRATADRRARSSGGFFTEDQIFRTLRVFCEAHYDVEEPGNGLSTTFSPLVPDLRLLICVMCGGDFSVETAIRPFTYSRISTSTAEKPLCSDRPVFDEGFLFHENPRDFAHTRNSFIFETSCLPNSSPSRKLLCQITILSYHSALALLSSSSSDNELLANNKIPFAYHGCILFYSAHRRASLANLNCFAHLVPDIVPLQIVCVGDFAEFFSNTTTSTLLTEGNDLAERIGARFVTLSKNADIQLTMYTPFLDEVYSKKAELDVYLMKLPSDDDHRYAGIHTQTKKIDDLEDSLNRIRLDSSETGSGVHRNKQSDFDYENATTSSEDPSHYGQLSQLYSGPDEQQSIYQNYRSISRSLVSVGERTNDDFPASDNVHRQQEQGIFGDPSTSMYEYDEQRGRTASSNAGYPPFLNHRDNGYFSIMRNQNDLRGQNNWFDDGSSDTALVRTDGGKGYTRHQPSSVLDSSSSSSLRDNVPSLTKQLTNFYRSRDQLMAPPLLQQNNNLSTNTVPSATPIPVSKELHNGCRRDETIITGGSSMARQLSVSDAVYFAPLATPENLELGSEYMTVKDALIRRTTDVDSIEEEAQYATVASIFPPIAQTDDFRKQDLKLAVEFDAGDKCGVNSPNENSSPVNPYERTGRKPTPHRKNKKKVSAIGPFPNISERVRRLNAASAVVAESQDAAPAYSRSSVSHRDSPRKDANFSTDNYFYANSSCYRDEDNNDNVECIKRKPLARSSNATGQTKRTDPKSGCQQQETPGSPGLIRRLGSSFRFRCGLSSSANLDKAAVVESPLLSPSSSSVFGFGGGGTKSVPQSPIVRERSFIVPSLSGATFYREHPPEASTSLIWLNPSTSKGDVASSISPKRVFSEKPPFKDRKISRDMVKKISSELPLKYPSLSGLTAALPQKKRSTKDPPALVSSTLVPTEARLKDLRFSDDDPVPLFLRKCVEFIEEEGFSMEGLYRVPGNQAQVVTLEQKFIENPSISFRALDIPVNAVTTALKNFFSYLSEPLIPYSMYGDLMDAMNLSSLEQKIAKINQIMKQLPEENRSVLFYFISHLRKVAQHAHTTAMDHRNLAKCWWPTLLRPKFESFETMAQMTQKLEEFVQLLLENPQLLLLMPT